MATASGTITQWSGRVSKSWLPSSSSFSSTSSTPTSDASGGIRISSPSSGTNNAYTCCMKFSPGVSGTISSITFNIKMYDANSSSSTYYFALCSSYPSTYGTQSGTTYYENNAYGYTSKSISSGSSSNVVSVTINNLSISGSGTYYLYIYTHSTNDIGIVYKSSSSHTYTVTYTAPASYGWTSLGSGSASSVSFNLSSYKVGYYLYTPSSNGTLTVYSSSSQDTYGGIGVNGSVGLNTSSSNTGGNVVYGYSVRDDDSYGNSQFTCTLSVTSGTTYRIYVHAYSGGATSGTLYMSFVGNGYSWISLGSGRASSASFNLSQYQVGYYLYTPNSNGTLAIYSTGSTDTYGGMGVNGNLALSSSATSGNSIVTGTKLTYNDDDGDGNNFSCTAINVTSGTTYRIYVHGFNNAASGTLYMSFVAAPTTYTITFNANGGSGAPSAITCAIGNSITIPTTKPTRSGYIFLGWGLSSTAAWCGGDGLYVGGTYTPNATRTLYAIWGYTLTINPNGGTMVSGSTSSGSTTATTSFTVGFTKTATYGRWLGNFAGSRYLYTATGNYCQPIRTGYRFNGWTVTAGNGSVVHSPAGTEFYSFYNDDYYYGIAHSGTTYGYYYYINNETTPTHSTITAQWLANTYTITYNANGGSGTTANSSHTYGVAKNLTANGFTRTGYRFLGWSDSSTATSATYTDQQSVTNLSTTHGATVILYAVWARNTYTIIYNANGGVGTMASSSHECGVAKALSKNTFTKLGYTFIGWNTSATATSATYTDQQSVTDLSTTNGATITLYAIWKPYTNMYICTSKMSSDGKTLQWRPALKYVYTTK